MREQVDRACEGLAETCDSVELFEEVEKQFYNGITPKEIGRAMVLAARSRIETDPAYDAVASRLVLNIIYRESLGKSAAGDNLNELYVSRFAEYVNEGVQADRISPKLLGFDLQTAGDGTGARA